MLGRRKPPIRDLRKEMVDETSAFLTWAMQQENMPRIPLRRMDRGGFADLMKMPGARALASQWWARAMDKISSRL